MANWFPHIQELLGDDPAAGKQIDRLLLIRRALTDGDLPAPHCARLVRKCGQLDTASRIFLLPQVVTLLAIPSPQVQHAVGDFLSDLGQWGHIVRMLQSVTRTGGSAIEISNDGKRPTIGLVLEQLARLAEGEAGNLSLLNVDREASFALLPVIRVPIFVMASLSGIWQWASRQAEVAAITAEYESVILEQRHAALRGRLLEWFTRGPMFLRYHLAQWIGQTGTRIAPDLDPRSLLLKAYRDDLQPIVAGEAICAYAHLVKADEIKLTVRLLLSELRSFRSRTFTWAREVSADSALTELSTSILRALGTVATAHFPDRSAIEALRDIVRERPCWTVNLKEQTEYAYLDLVSAENLSEIEREKIFMAALLLFGQKLTIRVELEGQRVDQGFVGTRHLVKLDDPQNWCRRFSRDPSFTAIAVPQPGSPGNPLKWQYQITGLWRDGQHAAADMWSLISPTLMYVHQGREPKLRGDDVPWQRAGVEIDNRAPWMQAMCEQIVKVLAKAMQVGASLTDRPLGELLEYLIDMVGAVERIPRPRNKYVRHQIRNRLFSVFLGPMARHEIIAQIANSVDESPVRKQLLTNLAHTGLRSLPDAPGYSWIANTQSLLRAIGDDRVVYLRTRCHALLALRYHSARTSQRALAELANSLADDSANAIFKAHKTAICLLTNAALNSLLTSTPEADPAAAPYLACERLCRSLESQPLDAADQEGDAATLLSFLCRIVVHAGEPTSEDTPTTGQAVPARLPEDLSFRLLQAFATSRTPLTGNVRRLLDHLLRHCSAAALRFFFDCLPSAAEVSAEIISAVVQLSAQDQRTQDFPLETGLDLQGMRDRLARPTIVQRQLCLMAQRGTASEFFAQYAAARKSHLAPLSLHTVIAHGEVLSAGDELLALLGTQGNGTREHSQQDLTKILGDLIPVFVHCPQPGDSVRCLVKGIPVRLGTIDFHSLPMDANGKEEFLNKILTPSETVLLLARVVEAMNPAELQTHPILARISLGVAAPDVGIVPRPVVVLDETFQENDVVTVELRKAHEWMLRDPQWECRPQALPGLPIYDLRLHANGTALLKALWDHPDKSFQLKVTVAGARHLPNGATRLFLRAGFSCCWGRENQVGEPSVLWERAEAPAVGRQLFLRPIALSFEQTELPAIQIRAVPPPAMREGLLVTGTLHSARKKEGGRRLWTAHVGDVGANGKRRLPVDRVDLTGDFDVLHRLDELPDDHDVLSRLKTEPCQLRVVVASNSVRLSVIKTPARWRLQELVVALILDQVRALTVLSVESNGGMVFEVLRRGGVRDGERPGSLPVVGILVQLAEGELFDKKGRPVTSGSLRGREGLRLRVTAKYGHLQKEGTYIVADNGDPFIQVVQEDYGNLTIRDAFPAGSLCRVKVVQGAVRKLELVDPPAPAGLSSTDILLRSDFTPGGEGELEVLVSKWDPLSPDLLLEVRRPMTDELDIMPGNAAAEVKFWLELETGDAIRGKRLGAYQGMIFCGGLRVRPDPLDRYLLPQSTTLDRQVRTARGLPLRLTSVSHRPSNALPLGPGVEVPFSNVEGRVNGLVVSTPIITPNRVNRSKRITVYWLHDSRKHDDEDEQLDRPSSERWSIDIEDEALRSDIRVGDVLTAQMSPGGVRVSHYGRQFYGTLLHQALDVDDWVLRVRTLVRARGENSEDAELVFSGTLWRKPTSSNSTWLFAMEPGFLVEIPASRLSQSHSIMSARMLDVVRIAVPRSRAGGSVHLEARDVYDGPLASWLNQQITINVKRPYRQRVWILDLVDPQDHRRIRTTFTDDQLPNGLTVRELQNCVSGHDKAITRNLRGYDFQVDRINDDNDDESAPGRYIFQLRPSFGDDSDSIISQQPSLEEMLAKSENGRLTTTGRVIAIEDACAQVELDHYTHNAPIPLTIDEQTRLRYTGPLVPNSWRGELLVIRSDVGPFASLKQLLPVPLGTWLRDRKLTNPHVPVSNYTLHYWGELSARETEQILSDDDEARHQRSLLFEYQPGIAILARLSQLTFMGEQFDPRLLGRGDIVDRFIVRPPSEAEGDAGIDIRGVKPDISLEIKNFSQKRGIFFGEIRLSDGVVSLEALRGAEYRTDAVGASRLARWRLVVETPADQQLTELRQSASDGELLTVYLRFVRADHDRGELVFRLIDFSDALEMGNLVWVGVDGKNPVSPYGDSLKLNVSSLQSYGRDGARQRARQGNLFIPDSLFSIRRGRLRQFRSGDQARMYLARVAADSSQSARGDVKLSLVENPHRPMRFFLNYSRRAVIVHRLESDNDKQYVRVELEEGVFVQLPLEQLDGVNNVLPPRRKGTLKPGDVLFMAAMPDGRASVLDLLISHRDYIDVKARPTLLTRLWGSHATRRQWLEADRDLVCDVIGLPQLEGYCNVAEENVECDEPIPQVVYGVARDGERLRLEERLGPGVVVGRLRLQDNGDEIHPVLEVNSNLSYDLAWASVTFRNASPTVLGIALNRMEWRNALPSSANEPGETIATSLVIGSRQNGEVSLVKFADDPFPMEHLMEQLPPASPGRPPTRRSFVVARAEPERLVLEVAPGRYAELRTSVVKPLYDGKWNDGLKAEWDRLQAGDEVEIERARLSEEPTDDFLSAVRIRRVSAGNSRQLGVPYVTVLHATSDGPVLGIPGPAAIPATRIAWLLHDHVLDLHTLPPGSARYRALAEHAVAHGSTVVLLGWITNSIAARNGWLHFIDIGIKVPTANSPDWRDPVLFIDAPQAMERGAKCHVRILDIQFDAREMTNIDYAAVPVETGTSEPNGLLIRGENGQHRRFAGMPKVADSVMVYRPQGTTPSDCRVLGYERFNVEWSSSAGDPLHLQNENERARVFSHLLADPADVVWATVETVNERTNTFCLSRRIQLEHSLPKPGCVSRAHVRGALSSKRLLVQVMEVPTVLPTDQFCLGSAGRAFADSVETLAVAFAGNQSIPPTDLEVVCNNDGSVSGKSVYRLESPPEAEAIVEYATAEGVLALYHGNRFFVPKRELAWCALDGELVQRLFPRHSRLLVRIPANQTSGVFSHVKTREIEAEIAFVRRLGEESIYVARADDSGQGPALVRGQSGVLMQLQYEGDTPLPDRFPAYVLNVNEADRIVALSPDRLPTRHWIFAREDEQFALDCASQELVKSKLIDLETRLALKPEITTVLTWASEQGTLQPSPRNLRLTVEVVAEKLGKHRLAQLSLNPGEIPFQRVWYEAAGLLSDTTNSSDKASAAARFLAGYGFLIQEQPANALPHLLAALNDEDVGRYFDVWICTVCALMKVGPATLDAKVLRIPVLQRTLLLHSKVHSASMAARDVAAILLAYTAERLWVEALRTLSLPLVEPASADIDAGRKWAETLAKGNLSRVRELLQSASQIAPYTARCQAHDLWLMIIEGQLNEGFDRKVNLFLETLGDEENHGQTADARLLLLASQLSFARGDMFAGWSYLNVAASRTTYYELDVARFWSSWLLDGSANPDASTFKHGRVDALLADLRDVYWRTRWRRVIDAAAFDRLWQTMRKSYHRWVLDVPRFRVVPRPLDHRDESISQWAECNQIPESLVGVVAERGSQ